MYYSNKINTLKTIFGSEDVVLNSNSLTVAGRTYPIIDDIIILSEPAEYTDLVKTRINVKESLGTSYLKDFSKDIQSTFGKEWQQYDKILPEHKREFDQYFDIVDLLSLKTSRLCDLGCGNGRWSYHLKDLCKELVLVDFSDAIFTARKNLSGAGNCLFFMCDLRKLPFKANFADFLFCIGVLHHLPVPCLEECRKLKRYAPLILVFLYYSLDNRPFYFRIILNSVNFIRKCLSKSHNAFFRKFVSLSGALFLYMPLILLGRMLEPLGLQKLVPLYEFYNNKSIKRIEQDVYDRFFTSIEQRVSVKEIFQLKDTFSEVTISDNLPYHHFLCKK